MTDSEGRLRGRLKRLSVGLAATAALILVVRTGASVWSQSRLREYREATQAEWDAERAQIRERSRPAGEGSAQQHCGASYASLSGIQMQAHPEKIKRAIEAGPGAPLSPDLLADIERHRPEMDAFRQAARCSHYELTEDSAWVEYGPEWRFMSVSRLALIEGHELAARGDVRGALDRYLTVAKVGADMSAGSLIAGLVGMQNATHAYRAVAALVAGAPRLHAAELADLDQALAERGRNLPLLADALRKERLRLRKAVMSLIDTGALPDQLPPEVRRPIGAIALRTVLSDSILVGHALPRMDAWLRDAEQIARQAQRDVSQSARVQEIAFDSLAFYATELNPTMSAELLQDLAGRDCALRTSYLVARATVEAERAYADGVYPEALRSLAQDICGIGPLVYRRSPSGEGYTLSSVGDDGNADGARAAGGTTREDVGIVITRRGASVL
ncbi:hypothetical protein [Sorangium sp. So ce176]|uniref:hypothetical protein n=1 Tax=Sorangium sp. So ce176 TaxID=3133286 RepID=UPI003F5F58AC